MIPMSEELPRVHLPEWSRKLLMADMHAITQLPADAHELLGQVHLSAKKEDFKPL